MIGVMLLAATACSPRSTPEEQAQRVGSLVVAWAEAEQELEPPLEIETLVLITSDEEWDRWLATLPALMRETRSREIDAVDLDSSVLVIGEYGDCDVTSSVIHKGEGALAFQSLQGEPPVVCAWSPLRVEVWRVTLHELGVGVEDVSLDSA